MNQNRRLAQLLFKDDFMFGAVMVNEEICRDFLEMAVGFPIEKVEISKEKSMIYHPEYRGIRLDIIARDENKTHYNVEMQVSPKSHLGKRARYYHSQMDMELLLTGEDYRELPAAYVIFICDFDPLGQKKYRYTFRNICAETGLPAADGSTTIFLSTCGKNEAEVPVKLVKFLKFVKADLIDSTLDYQDDFIRKIQKFMEHVRSSREMEEKFMLLEELLKDERAEGKLEGRAEGKAESILLLLQDIGSVS
ncbi:Rpn family recombination-promoting nuclease/putative transposase, partial [Blautia marasmi]|uniref:Rpn family recombination-promoting nuclease/putative transposase n=1 Tax=Blautia marasmi TaxID=1917868 RepID=UPI00266B858C